MTARWIALVGVMAAFPAVAQAQRATGDEIVVTAPLEGSRIESLQGAAVLGRQEVVNQLVGGLGETVASLPGVSSTFFGAGASRPVIRGLGEDRVRVLQNGVGAIDASAASPDHAVTADGLDADRIEVLRGAAALAYGGNAVGGVINVIDQSIPTRRPEGGYDVSVLAGYGSGDESTQANLAGVFDAGPLVLRFDVANRETENYDIPGFARSAARIAAEPLDPADPDLVEQSGAAPNSFTSLTSYAGGASLARDWGFAGVAVKQTETEYGLPPEDAGAALGGRIDLEQTRVETRGDVKIALGPFDRIDWGAQWADYTHQEIEDTGEVATTFTNEGYELRLEAHHNGFADRLDGAIGLQASDTDFGAVGEEAFLSATATTDLGVFAVERLDFGRWGLEGGARVERRDLDNVNAGSRDFAAVSGSAGVFYRPAQNWFLGATLARTERAPTAVELFADGPHVATGAYELGDAALDKETATSIEGSIRYADAKRRFEISLYHADYEDFLALVDTGLVFVESSETFEDPALVAAGEDTLPVFSYVARDARFTGGEISVASELFTAGGVTVSADGAVDYVRADFDGGGALPRIPPRTVTVGADAVWRQFSARAEVVDVARQDRVAAFETATDGYTLLNARLTLQPVADDDRIRLILDGRNLTDEDAREHVSFLKDVLPRPGRTVRLVLTAAF
ncbi:MAG: TonB-dependent receptor [Hyphomonadaceae bacterium]|nr:TonB-dependent receptor [Hyphomonadaceae bacterium]